MSKGNDRIFRGVTSEAPKGTWTVFPDLCKGCGICIERCPTDAIVWSKELCNYGTPRVDVISDKCIVCSTCATYCPDAAINVERTATAAKGKDDSANVKAAK